MGGKILVVDDDPFSLGLLEIILTQNGHNVLPAATGEDAVRAAEKESPDLVLMDICLPGMSGIEAMRTIRKNAGARYVKIVAVTALHRERGKMLPEGFDGFVPKPFRDPKALITGVESFLL